MGKIKYFIQESWLLIVASFFFGLLIAVTSSGLSPKIRQNEINKRNRLVSALLPEAKNFIPLEEQIEIESHRGKKENIVVYKAVSDTNECVGWSFEAVGSGLPTRLNWLLLLIKIVKKSPDSMCWQAMKRPVSGIV